MVNDSRLIRVLKNKPVDSPPIWFMRQAGRYLPEYKEIRAKAGSFLDLCKAPALAAEVTLQPLKRFDLDAAIVFSDILVIPDAYGSLDLEFTEKFGPCFKNPIQTRKDATNLPTLDITRDLSYVLETISIIRSKLPKNIPLIGFSGSPWTIATYMVEGSSSKTYSIIKSLLYRDLETLEIILTNLTKNIIAYAKAQINAGANVFMLFDTWGGILTEDAFLNCSLKYLQQIVTAIKAEYPHIPVILFCKNGGKHLSNIRDIGCDGIGLDWTASINKAKNELGNSVALQGNLDPAILYGSDKNIDKEVLRLLAAFGSNSRHIFNLGHGILPDVDPKKVDYLIKAVRKFSKEYYSQHSALKTVGV